jgi:uncharacterized protein (TIGR04562 family)
MNKSLASTQFVPVLSNEDELHIPWEALHTMIGGRSLLDTSEFYVTTRQEAMDFLQAYGIDLSTKNGQLTANEVKAEALAYLSDTLLPFRDINAVPQGFAEVGMEDLCLAASSWSPADWPNWPCVILKLCHAAAHTRWGYDTAAHLAAAEVIKARIQKYLYQDHGTYWIGDGACAIPLVDYQIKETKRFSRVMTKLLHKPGNMCSAIVDHIGLRFVTYDLFSVILLVRFLRTRGIFMYANSSPLLARNPLMEISKIEELVGQFNPDVVLSESFKDVTLDQVIRTSDNPFSSKDFKMVKLVERLLITLSDGRRTFFPYEIQIMDRATYLQTVSGASNHDAYEKRQLDQVRRRVFGRLPGFCKKIPIRRV